MLCVECNKGTKNFDAISCPRQTNLFYKSFLSGNNTHTMVDDLAAARHEENR